MKRILLLTMLATMQLTLWAAKNDNVDLRIVVKGYESGCVLLARGHDYDTLRTDKKGRFVLQQHIKYPMETMIVVDQFRNGALVYLENGMKGTLTLSFRPEPFEGQTMYMCTYEYEGTMKDCVDFYRDFQPWEMGSSWPFEKMATYDFPTYRRTIEQEAADFRQRLEKMKNENFKQLFVQRVNGREKENLMRYAWSKNSVDADFEKYLNSFDRNDKKNGSFAADYQRWWHNTHLPAEGFTNGTWYMEGLKRNFTNQQRINGMAASYMASYIRRAPKDLTATWEAFRQTCTDKEAVAKLQKDYDKFNPDTDAPDFEITGCTDGKTYTLKDFRGKALYIDCWATWCGPCVAETPHLRKLVEHFKDDNRVEFIGVSFDSNRTKLDNYLAEEKPTWRQFWCKDGFDSAIAKGYGFSGIPRFIFIDKNGKLIAGDAPRPSYENVIQFIEDGLK